MQHRRLLLLLLIGATVVGFVGPGHRLAQAQVAPDTRCAPGQAPRFVFGFAELQALLGEVMGEPATCEFPDPNGTGDVHQVTSTGLAFWRKSTNTPTFTTGWEHWALTPAGLVSWTGESIDPPAGLGGVRPRLYLALGDSLAAGVGATLPVQTGYVARLAAALSSAEAPVQARNLALERESSTSFMEGGQLARALATLVDPAADIGLVTLHLGGNDLLHLVEREPCASNPISSLCRETVAASTAHFAANYGLVLDQLAGALRFGPTSAPLAVLTYYNPLSGTATLHEILLDRVLLGRDRAVDCGLNALDPDLVGLNDVVVCEALRRGIPMADVHPAFKSRALELTHIRVGNIHPNDAGHAVIADVVHHAVAGLLAAP